MQKHVIISKHKDNVEWVNKLNMPYTIIDKLTTKNLGSEAWSYIHFIISNYHDLPDRMLFVHGHDMSYHQDYPTVHIANNLNWDLQYMNINSRKFDEQYMSVFGDFEDVERGYRKSYELWIKNSWTEVFGDFILPHTLTFLGHAQFLVCKEFVLRHDKPFYERILKWLETTTIDEKLYIGRSEMFNKKEAYVSGRILEYTWHYIFTGDPEEHIDNYLM